jgi:hypothetical protein
MMGDAIKYTIAWGIRAFTLSGNVNDKVKPAYWTIAYAQLASVYRRGTSVAIREFGDKTTETLWLTCPSEDEAEDIAVRLSRYMGSGT